MVDFFLKETRVAFRHSLLLGFNLPVAMNDNHRNSAEKLRVWQQSLLRPFSRLLEAEFEGMVILLEIGDTKLIAEKSHRVC